MNTFVAAVATVVALLVGACWLLFKRRLHPIFADLWSRLFSRFRSLRDAKTPVATEPEPSPEPEPKPKARKKAETKAEECGDDEGEWKIRNEEIKLPKVYFGDFGKAMKRRGNHKSAEPAEENSSEEAPAGAACPFAAIFGGVGKLSGERPSLENYMPIDRNLYNKLATECPVQPAGKGSLRHPEPPRQTEDDQDNDNDNDTDNGNNNEEGDTPEEELQRSHESWTFENGHVRKKTPYDFYFSKHDSVDDSSERERIAEDMRREAEVRKQQLEAIFKLLQEQEKKAAGESCTMDDLADQMKMYI